MTFKKLAILMEALYEKRPTTQVRLLSREMENFNQEQLVKLLNMDLAKNNIAITTAKKWIADFFQVFPDELEELYTATNDIGEAVYLMDTTDGEEEFSLRQIISLLEMDCSSRAQAFDVVKEIFLNMSDVERKWFTKFWIRTPNNGLGLPSIQKAIANHYGKKVAEVKRHCTLNSLSQVVVYYGMGQTPPMELEHGKFIKPMLAKVKPQNQWPSKVMYDVKYDGNRYQIHRDGGSVIVFNRRGKIVNNQFPDVIEHIKQYNENRFILDGEIYPIRSDGSPDDHKKMGTRVHSKSWEDARKVTVKWVIFDCLYYKDTGLLSMDLESRLKTVEIEPLMVNDLSVRQIGGDFSAFYNRAIADGFEGIMVKDLEGFYEPGKRTWIKFKPPRIDLDVVILGAEYGEHSKKNVFATFVIGVSDPTTDSGYTEIGRVGNGFTDEELTMLTNKLRRIITNFNKEIYSVIPSVIIEVTADAVTKNKSGSFGLRFPRKVRFREDKVLSEINAITDVINMF